MPRSRLSPSQRRAVILDAAGAVFAAHGYDAASMRQIAAASGATTPILYDHFPSKQALYLQLLEDEVDALVAATAGVTVRDSAGGAAGGGDADGAVAGDLALLAAGADAFFTFVEERPHAWRMLFRDVPGDPRIAEQHRALQRRGDRVIAALLEDIPGLRLPPAARAGDAARSRDAARPGDAALDMLAVAVRSVVNGLASWWWDHRDTPRADVVAVAVHLLAHGLLEQRPADTAVGTDHGGAGATP